MFLLFAIICCLVIYKCSSVVKQEPPLKLIDSVLQVLMVSMDNEPNSQILFLLIPCIKEHKYLYLSPNPQRQCFVIVNMTNHFKINSIFNLVWIPIIFSVDEWMHNY